MAPLRQGKFDQNIPRVYSILKETYHGGKFDQKDFDQTAVSCFLRSLFLVIAGTGTAGKVSLDTFLGADGGVLKTIKESTGSDQIRSTTRLSTLTESAKKQDQHQHLGLRKWQSLR
jgi:hypothetical protein